MKTLKVLGITAAVLVMLFLGIAMFLPSEVHVEREITVPASSEVAFSNINDLRQWKYWSPWYPMGPNMEIVFENRLRGKGAGYRWYSEQMGSGKLVIIESQPYSYIATSVNFMEQGEATSHYYFEPVDEGTQITWTFETDLGNGPVAKYTGLLIDNMIGSDFEQGLAKLKGHIKRNRLD